VYPKLPLPASAGRGPNLFDSNASENPMRRNLPRANVLYPQSSERESLCSFFLTVARFTAAGFLVRVFPKGQKMLRSRYSESDSKSILPLAFSGPHARPCRR